MDIGGGADGTAVGAEGDGVTAVEDGAGADEFELALGGGGAVGGGTECRGCGELEVEAQAIEVELVETAAEGDGQAVGGLIDAGAAALVDRRGTVGFEAAGEGLKAAGGDEDRGTGRGEQAAAGGGVAFAGAAGFDAE